MTYTSLPFALVAALRMSRDNLAGDPVLVVRNPNSGTPLKRHRAVQNDADMSDEEEVVASVVGIPKRS